jgi:hypothetical protein
MCSKPYVFPVYWFVLFIYRRIGRYSLFLDQRLTTQAAMKISLLISFVVGAIVMGLIMYASWDHQSQCEIHCDGTVEWAYWLLIGFSWFVPSFVSTFILSAGVSYVVRRVINVKSA